MVNIFIFIYFISVYCFQSTYTTSGHTDKKNFLNHNNHIIQNNLTRNFHQQQQQQENKNVINFIIMDNNDDHDDDHLATSTIIRCEFHFISFHFFRLYY